LIEVHDYFIKSFGADEESVGIEARNMKLPEVPSINILYF
jgi:hypothetical protein